LPGRVFVENIFARREKMNSTCPECDGVITMTKPIKGEIVVCPDCGAELEVVSENPLQLDLAPQEEEDWGE
jgi:alpha-aminoadipate/glutamate carrier protein LysW